jgi:hypothetical protein
MDESCKSPGWKLGRKRKRGFTVRQLRGTKRTYADPDTAAILKEVRRMMKQKRISVKDLAIRSGLSKAATYQYLNPVRSGIGPFRITVIRALAHGCGVKLSQLLSVLEVR